MFDKQLFVEEIICNFLPVFEIGVKFDMIVFRLLGLQEQWQEKKGYDKSWMNSRKNLKLKKHNHVNRKATVEQKKGKASMKTFIKTKMP